jgi:hypothetical protein
MMKIKKGIKIELKNELPKIFAHRFNYKLFFS